MIKFSDFLSQSLTEKLMVFGKSAYPKFGNIVILAGGAGSGKGFQSGKLLGIEGKTFDVDALKELAVKSTKFAAKVKEETGHDMKTFDMRKPENVGKLHDILASVYNVTNKHQQTTFASILASDAERKPNLIFDVTLKDLSKLESISRNVVELGYEKKNVHIVWIVNDINVAIEQNKNRSRVVPDEILMATHEGAALTMKKLLDMGDKIQKYMDGDIYISFNKVGVDVGVKKSGNGGSYIKDANYIKVKKQGQRQLSSKDLEDEVYNKIKNYVPKTDTWS
jgi:hypothetical protein